MFKICIVFKISIRRDGGSPCRKRKKEESSAATGSFSGFVCGEIARTRLMHRHSTADNYATALRSFLAFQRQGHLCRGGQQAGRCLRGMAPEKGYAKDTLSCYALFACCLQQGGGTGAYGAKNLSSMCLQAFPAPETFDRRRTSTSCVPCR